MTMNPRESRSSRENELEGDETDLSPVKRDYVNRNSAMVAGDEYGDDEVGFYHGRTVSPVAAGDIMSSVRPTDVDDLADLLTQARLDGDENHMNPIADMEPAHRVARGSRASNAAIANVLGMRTDAMSVRRRP